MNDDPNSQSPMRSRFIEISRDAFEFLESRFGFRRLPPTNEILPYQSTEVLVNVFHRLKGGELGLEFGLLPQSHRPEDQRKWWRLLFHSEEPHPAGEPQIPMYDLKVALPVLVAPASMSGELRALLGGPPAKGEYEPIKTWNSWWSEFSAIKVDEIEPRVRRLAALTLQYVSPLLAGDRDAFRKVQEHDAELTDEYSRKVHLSFLPTPLAESLKNQPLSEIIRVRRERGGW